MNEGGDRSQMKGPQRNQRIDREVQGDLLAEAVTGFFSSQIDDEAESGPAEAAAEEAARRSDTGIEAGQEAGTETGTEVGAPRGAEAGAEPALGPNPDEDVETIPDSPWEQKMAWAKARASQGRLKDAEELYRELVEEDPTNVRALNNLGILLDEMGDSEGAVAQLQAAKRVEPLNPEVLGNLGGVLGAMGKYSDAEEALRSAQRLDPANMEIRANLGILLFRRGLYDQAAAELATVCAARPDDGLSLFYRGEALNRLGRVEEAIKVLLRVTELVPGNHKAYYTLGVLFDKKNVPEKAAAMYRKAREFSKT